MGENGSWIGWERMEVGYDEREWKLGKDGREWKLGRIQNKIQGAVKSRKHLAR